MKKLLCLLLAVLFVLPLAACGATSPLPGLNNGIDGNVDEMESLEAQIEALKKEYDQALKVLNDKITALEKDVATKDDEIKALKNEIDQIKADYNAKIAALEMRLENKTEPPEVTTDPPSSGGTICDGSYRYNAYVRVNSGNAAFYCEDFWVETASDDALSYAVYDRNKTIEDSYDCHIRQFDSDGDQYAEMTRFYFNDEPYELAILLGTSAVNCAVTGLLNDVYSLDNIDLSHKAYDQNSIQQLSLGGTLYYFSGDMNISTMDSAAVTIFNPTLFRKYDFVEELGNEAYDNLYEMVMEGTWTVSAMLEMAEVVNIDAAGDGGTLVAADGDRVGYLASTATPMYYWYGCGARITENGKDGYPSLVFGAEGGNSAEVFNFLYTQLNNQQPEKSWLTSGGSSYRISEFKTDAVLFTDTILWDVRKMLHSQDKARYGILPTPKFHEEQESYYDLVYWSYGTAHLWSIPRNCKNLNYASSLLHIIATYSSESGSTMDAYYSKTLEFSMERNLDAYVTLKIVRDSLTYDIFLLYDWGSFIQSLIENLDTASTNQYSDWVNADNLAATIADMELTMHRFKTTIDPI